MEAFKTVSGHTFPDDAPGTQFTSFTCTKVQILTLPAQLGDAAWALRSVKQVNLVPFVPVKQVN